MSNSPLATYTRLTTQCHKNRERKIDGIAIHCMVGQMTGRNCADYFATCGRQASSNYCVGPNGDIAVSVNECDRAFTTSSSYVDSRCVTIEVASDTTHPYAIRQGAYDALIKLCVDICKRNGIKKLVWSTNKTDRVNWANGCNMQVHRDYASKSCPGDYLYSRMGQIAEEVNRQLGTSTGATNVVNNTNPVVSTNDSYVTVGSGVKLRELGKGDKGNDCHMVMVMLKYLGYYKLNADNEFGPSCDAAVKAFQKARKLTADGIVGKQTWGSLLNNCRTLQRGASGQDCALLMAMLKDLGYYTLNIDNSFGSYCDAAVKKFQKAKGLVVDGVVGAQTWGALLVK